MEDFNVAVFFSFAFSGLISEWLMLEKKSDGYKIAAAICLLSMGVVFAVIVSPEFNGMAIPLFCWAMVWRLIAKWGGVLIDMLRGELWQLRRNRRERSSRI